MTGVRCQDHDAILKRLYVREYRDSKGQFIPYAWTCPVDGAIFQDLRQDRVEQILPDPALTDPQEMTDSNNELEFVSPPSAGLTGSIKNRLEEKYKVLELESNTVPAKPILKVSQDVIAPRTLKVNESTRNIAMRKFFVLFRPREIADAKTDRGKVLQKLLETGDIFAQRRVSYTFMIPDGSALKEYYGLEFDSLRLSRAIIKGEKINPDDWVSG